MITPEEVKLLDINSAFFGVPTQKLMEGAGRAIHRAFQRNFGKGRKVLIVCGTGNNGGDGLTAARYLAQENEVKIYLVGPPRTPEAKEAYNLAVEEGIEVISILEDGLNWSEVIVDALLGVGGRGRRVKEPYRTIILKMNESGKPIISVDTPSGYLMDVKVNPTITVTFHDVKEGMLGPSGKIIVADIGIPREAETCVGPGDVYLYYPRPPEDAHKGQRGRIGIIGGSRYPGSLALAGLAAYRLGVDLVSICVPEQWMTIYLSYAPVFIVHPLPGKVVSVGAVEIIREATSRAHAILIGPGMGKAPDTETTVEILLRELDIPMVIDADGLWAIREKLDLVSNRDVILTPHAKEFETLFGEPPGNSVEEREKLVKEKAKDLGVTILLKGKVDVISDGKRLKRNVTGSPAMATGGTGDVLSGAVTALRARGAEPFRAACMASFLVGLAGAMASQKFGYGIMATDLIDNLGILLKEILEDPFQIEFVKWP